MGTRADPVRAAAVCACAGFVERGFVTGPGGKAFGSSGVVVNCPIVHRFL